MNTVDTPKDLLEIHKMVADELRHSATVIWQFSIAIVTLQGGAVALTSQSGFPVTRGKWILAAAFFLSGCFSIMLVRQARERSGFVTRILAVETELRRVYPLFFAEIPRSFSWFTSMWFARTLLVESAIGSALFVYYLAR